MKDHLTTGKKGEELAAHYLEERGFRVLSRNVANPRGKRLGEIDIVAKKGREIVFVEVKTLHKGPEEWLPEWNVTRSKLEKLSRIAEYVIKKEKWEKFPYRFDVIAVVLDNLGKAHLKHIEHAFF